MWQFSTVVYVIFGNVSHCSKWVCFSTMWRNAFPNPVKKGRRVLECQLGNGISLASSCPLKGSAPVRWELLGLYVSLPSASTASSRLQCSLPNPNSNLWIKVSPPDLHRKLRIRVFPPDLKIKESAKTLQRMPERMPKKMSEPMPDRMLEKMPDSKPKQMPESQIECQNRCQKECQNICHKVCQNRCQVECQIDCQIRCQKECQSIYVRILGTHRIIWWIPWG